MRVPVFYAISVDENTVTEHHCIVGDDVAIGVGEQDAIVVVRGCSVVGEGVAAG